MGDDSPKVIDLVDDDAGQGGINLGHGEAEGKAHQHPTPLEEGHMAAESSKPPPPPPPPPPTPGAENIARPPGSGTPSEEG